MRHYTSQAPQVDAGPDQVLNWPNTGTVFAPTVTDDGWPPGSLTYTWTELSGLGTVSFRNFRHLITTATFPTTGAYVLQLAV